MIYINQNKAAKQLETIVELRLQDKLNIKKSLHSKQPKSYNLLQQRIHLEEVIETSVDFNKKVHWEEFSPNLRLVSSVEELIAIYKLRSDVYTDIGYQEEFPDTIEGLNFDDYDKTSAILFYTSNNVISGTTRLIFDKNKKLPTEKKFSFNDLRQEYNNISELSRLIIKHHSNGLNVEFKNLTRGVYEVYHKNNIDIILSGIRQDHFKLYSKFGGFNIEQELDGYGKLDVPFLITSWNASQTSAFFERAFLR